MSTERDPQRIVLSWLRSDEHVSADRLLDVVLFAVDTTPQRRSSWLAWRSPTMNKLVGFGLAAAAVVIAAVIGIQLMGDNTPGGPPPAPSPAPSSIPTLEIQAGLLNPGPYLITDVEPFTITITVPSGWEALDVPAQVWGSGENRPTVGYMTLDGLWLDVCDESQGYHDLGPTVEDLVTALRSAPGIYVAGTSDVVVSGYNGTMIELTGAGIDCGSTRPNWMTTQPGSVDRPHPAVFWGETQLTVLDVEGDQLLILSTLPAESSPEAVTGAQSIFESTVIQAR